MNIARYAAVLVASFVAACGAEVAPTVAPTPGVYEVDASNQSGTFTIWVLDNSGLVTGARRWVDGGRSIREGNSVIIASPESSEIAVGWIGGVCYHGPTVTVDGPGDAAHITIRPDEGVGPPGGACIDLGAFFGVVLNLSSPVQQDAVSVQVVR